MAAPLLQRPQHLWPSKAQQPCLAEPVQVTLEGASGNARQLFYGLPKVTRQVTSSILVGPTSPSAPPHLPFKNCSKMGLDWEAFEGEVGPTKMPDITWHIAFGSL